MQDRRRLMGKVLWAGEDSCSGGRENKHIKMPGRWNKQRNIDPVVNIQQSVQYWWPGRMVSEQNLGVYCGMAFDKKERITSLCLGGRDDSLFVWNKETIDMLKQQKHSLREYLLLEWFRVCGGCAMICCWQNMTMCPSVQGWWSWDCNLGIQPFANLYSYDFLLIICLVTLDCS